MSLDKTKPTTCADIDILYYCWCWRHKKDNATLYDDMGHIDVPHLSGCKGSFFSSQLWLARLPSHRQELTFAPIQMRILPPQRGGRQQVHTYPLYSSAEGLQVTPEKQLQKYVCLVVPKAVAYLRTEQRSSSLAQLITIALCLAYSPPPSSGVIICLFFPSNLSVYLFFSNFMASRALHHAPSTHIHWLVSALSAITADEVLQMKPCTCMPNHFPETMAENDMISSTILPICKSQAEGL